MYSFASESAPSRMSAAEERREAGVRQLSLARLTAQAWRLADAVQLRNDSAPRAAVHNVVSLHAPRCYHRRELLSVVIDSREQVRVCHLHAGRRVGLSTAGLIVQDDCGGSQRHYEPTGILKVLETSLAAHRRSRCPRAV